MIDEDRSQSTPEDSPEAVDATVDTADISSEEAVPVMEPAVDTPAEEIQVAEESTPVKRHLVVEAPVEEAAEEPVIPRLAEPRRAEPQEEKNPGSEASCNHTG